MERLLGVLVDVDSPSGDAIGIQTVADRVEAFLRSHGIVVTRPGADSTSAMLHASVGPEHGQAPLLLGHMDTVFPAGTVAHRPFHIEGERLLGPGVADMKAGLVMNSFVLAAFSRLGADAPSVRSLYTVDEEVASPSSRSTIEAASLDASCVLNAEPARANGNVVVKRKGGLFLQLTIEGQSAHSGVNFTEGASAIEAIAHKIVAITALTDNAVGITANVGLVSGGQSVNTVAPYAEAGIDIRYPVREQREGLLAHIRAICTATEVAGTRTTIQVTGEFLPMEPSEQSLRLFEAYRQGAAEIGFTVDGESTGGCSDAGLSASLGVPTLCGLGPIGGNAHTTNEYVERASLVPRAQALALLVLRHGTTRLEDRALLSTKPTRPKGAANQQWEPT
ncbi:M20 family metallopeptidase [Mesorhizobium sp. RP14(2022)]|uniref:M20 family metallopeptidase n=1 Tax=Mesorhizobium liriopis TaxID=2953882 RepID=A0ABT1C335_9HYPH|nr:M20 family metallopeptidase [Mesorhizobium liriopis]MCO6049241.1 M20 family metallopeptidase [Mesorhizobium liriopis]